MALSLLNLHAKKFSIGITFSSPLTPLFTTISNTKSFVPEVAIQSVNLATVLTFNFVCVCLCVHLT